MNKKYKIENSNRIKYRKSPLYYANGLNISQARRLLKYLFGDFFIKADVNQKDKCFDIYLNSEIVVHNGIQKLNDYHNIKRFNIYWNSDNSNYRGCKKKEGIFRLIIMEVKLQTIKNKKNKLVLTIKNKKGE